MCTKRSFASEKAAKRANRSSRFRIRAYRCDRCKLYHVTNSDKPENAPMWKMKR